MGSSKSHYAVIDEVEEGTCVLLFDEGLKLNLDPKWFPPGTKEGSVLKVTFEIDEAERERRISDITALQQKLLKRTQDGK